MVHHDPIVAALADELSRAQANYYRRLRRERALRVAGWVFAACIVGAALCAGVVYLVGGAR